MVEEIVPKVRKQKTILERFNRLTQRGGVDQCWLWLGALRHDGYGQMCIGSSINGTKRMTSPHRVSFQLFVGAIPSGMSVCHKCDNPRCVNPNHLFLGTHAQNMADMHKKGRARGGSLPGEMHPSSKLTDSIVKAIRSSALTQDMLAQKYGISQSTVSAIKHGKKWKHLY